MTRFAGIFVALTLLCALLVLAPLTAVDRPDRTSPPQPGDVPDIRLPTIETRTLSNGLAVWLVESHEVPLVQVNLVVPGGSGTDPDGRYGLASLTADMLDEGTASRTALEIADQVEYLGATLATGSGFDAAAVRLNVPVLLLEDALALMADVALRPAFPEQELARIRQERITDLEQARDDPGSVAAMTFSRAVFGTSHRYGTGAVGTRQTIEAFTTDDLRRFHAAHYRPEGATLVVVGDIAPAELLPRLEHHFGSWQGRVAAPVAVPLAAQPAAGGITIVDMPGAAQSEIRMGWVGVPRSTPDYFPLQVLNTILGGSFTSRLNQNLRETHGYTYGASSRFDMRLSAGPFVAGAGVQTDRTAEALREFFNELRAIREPVPDPELTRARNYLALSFPAEFETLRDLSGHLEASVVYGLDEGWFERYVDAVQAVTSNDLQRAAATYIQPERFAVVIAGDAAAIAAGVRNLALGPVRVISVQEALGP